MKPPYEVPVFSQITRLGTAPEKPDESAITADEIQDIQSINQLDRELAILRGHVTYHREVLKDLTLRRRQLYQDYERALADITARTASAKKNLERLLDLRVQLHNRRRYRLLEPRNKEE